MKKLAVDYRRKKCWGMVAAVDVYGCRRALISKREPIRKFIIALCQEIKMKRHGEPLIERFAEGELEGFSALQFIETSSITCHFDEGKDRAFVDIFSCKYFDPQQAENFCKQYLGGTKSKLRHFFRK